MGAEPRIRVPRAAGNTESVAAAFARLADIPQQLARVEAQNLELLTEVADLKRRLPPQLGDVAAVCRVTGLSAATVRRRICDGTFPSLRVGARVLVDLAAVRPTEPEAIARLARKARGG